MLIDDSQDVAEVFCEHHEDVLLKHRDGSFTGHQVKTRAEDQPVWKAGDESIKSSCVRFIGLDVEFAGRFRGFRFLTNHPLHAPRNGQDFAYVLSECASAATVDQLPGPVKSWLRKIAKLADCSGAVALAAMAKTTVSADLPKLKDATVRLIDTLCECWSLAADCSHDSVRRAAQLLIEECGRASSLDHQQLLAAYIPALDDPMDAEQEARITGKKFSQDRVLVVLNKGLDATALLTGNPDEFVEPGHGSTELMLQKLDAGGFSAVSQNSAEDLRNKADYLGLKWTKQHGRHKGLARYDHMRSLVLADASRTFEAVQTTTGKFGPQMREALIRRFEERREHHDQLHDCANEHLEGLAFSLTAQCLVQWSLERPWETT